MTAIEPRTDIIGMKKLTFCMKVDFQKIDKLDSLALLLYDVGKFCHLFNLYHLPS